eukprot:357367-Chlamydomonas_euryale.AAC.1
MHHVRGASLAACVVLGMHQPLPFPAPLGTCLCAPVEGGGGWSTMCAQGMSPFTLVPAFARWWKGGGCMMHAQGMSPTPQHLPLQGAWSWCTTRA